MNDWRLVSNKQIVWWRFSGW